MKIKTLTTYNVYNYGASLQAYALMTYLSQLGHDVEIINYQPEYLTRKYNYKWVNPESKMSRYALARVVYRILKFLQRQTTLANKRLFDNFTHHMLHETTQLYHTFDELQKNPPEADVYIVGSDQIWNIFYEAGRDPVFYLEFVDSGKRISYAASFSYIDIDEENCERIARSLSKFDAVSVREYHGIDILRTMGIDGTWVLDPVFLLSVDEWKKLMKPMNETNEPYLLIYDFEGNNELKNFAIKYAKDKGLKMYSISDRAYQTRYADKHFTKTGPCEFISLIYHCSAFVSNSFHGTAFSIMFHKPFYVFGRNRHKVNSRMESLLSMFELSNRYIHSAGDYIGEQISEIDWVKIESMKSRFLNRSETFIQMALTES